MKTSLYFLIVEYRTFSQGRRQVKICGVDRHGERGAGAYYNGGLEAEPTGPTPPHYPFPCKNSSDLYQSQERPLAKVGWTCLPRGDAHAYNGGLGQNPSQEVRSGASPLKLKAL